jgi:uncharacterized protein YgfB (UPF0149 family)
MQEISFLNYNAFVDAISPLALPLSGSALHGQLCGFLCAGKIQQGETYIQTLMDNPKDETTRTAALALFSVYATSEQQIHNFDFSFALLLPDDEQPLFERAKAFSEWCAGFIHALQLSGIKTHRLDEETQNALEHITEFAQLDCETLDVSEDDEKALVEISEYTRMSVLRLHSDLITPHSEGGAETAH